MRLQKQTEFSHLRLPSLLRSRTSQTLTHLTYGPRTQEHLDLFESTSGAPTLYSFMNRTHCSLGARELKRWIAEPLADPESISKRQASVKALSQTRDLERLRNALKEVYDLERLCGRLTARLANPRDALALRRSLENIPDFLHSRRDPQNSLKFMKPSASLITRRHCFRKKS